MRIRTATGIVGLVIAATLCVGAGAARSGEAEAPSADRQELERLVKEEVQKQLPKAVAAEVRAQLGAIMAQAETESRVNSALSTLQTLRSQLELYKIQHNDKFPPFKEMTEWKALQSRTNAEGVYGDAATFGPYIGGLQRNPFNGQSRVVAAGSATVLAGWTWDDSKGVLRIIIPQEQVRFASHFGKGDYEIATDKVDTAVAGPASSIASTLQTVNSQLVLYQIQHGDRFPTLAQMKDWSALVQKTDATGNIGEKLPLGPYLRAAVVNPVNQKSAVVASGAAVSEAGWTYDEKKGAMRAIIPAGKSEAFGKYLPGTYFEVVK